MTTTTKNTGAAPPFLSPYPPHPPIPLLTPSLLALFAMVTFKEKVRHRLEMDCVSFRGTMGRVPAMIDKARFGIVGDGRADDAAALERAFAAAEGPVALPPGDYRLGRTVEWRLEEFGRCSLAGG